MMLAFLIGLVSIAALPFPIGSVSMAVTMISRNTSRLFHSLAARLKRFAMRCRVADSECEDCIQEAWLALLQRHPDWALDQPRTRAWLFAVVRNKARDCHRQAHRHQSQSADDLDSVPFNNPLPRAERQLDQNGRNREAASKLQDGLNRLSKVNREIFIQRAQEGLPYKEIGVVLGLLPQQVKIRYRRVLQRLRRQARNHARMHSKGGGRSYHRKSSLFSPDWPRSRPGVGTAAVSRK